MTHDFSDIVELGKVSAETNGLNPFGPIEHQTGTYYFLTGIEAAD